MNKALRNGLISLARFDDLLSDLGAMHGGVKRTPHFFEKLFPGFTYGNSDTKHGPIYLTFDDGPDPANTVPILKTLETHGVQGTFFLLGNKLPAALEATERILSGGHRIGYHGLSHKAWWFRPPGQRAVESDPTLLHHLVDNPFEKPGGKPLLLRPPYGRFDLTLMKLPELLDAHMVLWRLVVGDWLDGQDADDICGKLLANTRPGDIVVLHDGGKNGHLLADALDRVIPLWKMKGFRFGNIDDLVGGKR